MYAFSIDRSDGTERETDVESLRQKSRITYVRARDGGDRQTNGQPSCTSRRENEGEREAERKGKTKREREEERREIAERSVVGLVAIVMACAMVPMCQPPRQLSPLVRSAVKYAETTKPFARVKLVVITRIDILYIPANLSDSLFLSLECILFKSSLVNERMLAIERKCTRFVCPSIELTLTPKPSLLTDPEPALSSLKVTVDRKKIVRLYSRRCQP